MPKPPNKQINKLHVNILNTNSLHIITQLHGFLSHTDNFKQINLSHRWGFLQILWVRVDLRVIVLKGYSTLLKAPELEGHY